MRIIRFLRGQADNHPAMNRGHGVGVVRSLHILAAIPEGAMGMGVWGHWAWGCHGAVSAVADAVADDILTHGWMAGSSQW
ncbi:MAG TPA: hypothetical protein VN436_01705, partial [Holophaga sp.]|nr:hypothetical protein [Holophaga sp.]